MYAASVPIDSTLFQCVSADEQSAAGGGATTVAGEAGKVTRDVDFTGPDCGARVTLVEISSAGSAAGSDWAARFPGASAGGARGSGLLVATGASTAVGGLVVLSAAGGGAASSAGGARFGTASVAGAMGSGLAATGASTGTAFGADVPQVVGRE